MNPADLPLAVALLADARDARMARLTVAAALLSDCLDEFERGRGAALGTGGTTTAVCLSQSECDLLAAILADEREANLVKQTATTHGFRELLARWIDIIGHKVAEG